MKVLKNILNLIIYGAVITFLFINFDAITYRLANILISEPNVVIHESNYYSHENSFIFVQQTDDFTPYSKQDLKNIFFSILNSGWERFTFFCPRQYINCIRDVEAISSDNEILSHINNFVAPFNSFHHLSVIFSESGEVTVEVNRLYDQEMINALNAQADDIILRIINSEMNKRDKILAIHDYIINFTTYDIEHETSAYRSNTAYGPLMQGKGICSGYTDAMAIFLNRFNIPNFKIASSGHIWNAVYLDGYWFHLDLTWNDPVDVNNIHNQILLHTFFLISTEELMDLNTGSHKFNPLFYREMAR